LPRTAQAMIAASADLHRRVARLDEAQIALARPSPARTLQDRIALAF
jgi:regulator of CtrA degradation